MHGLTVFEDHDLIRLESTVPEDDYIRVLLKRGPENGTERKKMLCRLMQICTLYLFYERLSKGSLTI